MTTRLIFRCILALSFFAFFAAARPVAADSSHARIIRLSLVQGDVRFTRQAHGDPLADDKAVWETAALNLPIRQGYVLATDNGRAEVEFENGAMAFLNEHAVLEFYDLSLDDGARATRLVLRQGTASFYVNPSSVDYYSVTGGDFTVEANGKTSFRVDNFEDGSNVNVLSGRVSVLHKDETTALIKGESLSMKAGEDAVNLGRLPTDDEFDRWVSGRTEAVSTATNAALQYTNSPSYTSGFGDLYTYGSWFSCGGYGYGWRPFGAGFGWSPFTDGQWGWDPFFGWTWMSFQPWGWAPYHYGGWLFDAGCGGWFYSPPVFYGFVPSLGLPRRHFPGVHPPRPVFRGATAVFVRQNGKLGVVPMHPLDKEGKTPLNLEHGVFSTSAARGVGEAPMVIDRGRKLETVKSPSRDALVNSLVASKAPERVSRTQIAGAGGTRVVSLGHDSSIVYDPHEHRFVNTNAAPMSSVNSTENRKENGEPNSAGNNQIVGRTGRTVTPPNNTARVPGTPPASRRAANTPPPRTMTPPPAPRYSGGERVSGGGSSRGHSWGGSSGGGSSRGSSGSSAPTSHPSSSGGGGRPH
jgi:hypothetical protein